MATSITNTSITTDNVTTDGLVVDTNTLHVDATNNRVGINTTNGPESFNTTGNIRFQTNNQVRIEYLNSGGAYTSGVTGGAAVGFEYLTGGDHEIFFETHNSGVSHREVMRIDKDGYVTKLYQPAFRIGKTTGQQDSGGAYINPVSFQSAYFNVGNHFSTSTNKFTAPVAGRYLFGWVLGMYRYSASWMGIYSYVNNAFLAHSQTFAYSSPSWVNFDGSILVQLQVNDTFHLVGRNDSNAGIDNSGCFWGYLVG